MNAKIAKELIGKAFDEAVPYTWVCLNREEIDRLLAVFAEDLWEEAYLEGVNRGWEDAILKERG